MSTIIGRKIKRLRLEQHKKLKDLSESTGISIGYLSKIERENFTVSADTLKKIAEALGVSVQYFHEGPTVIHSYEHTFRYSDEEKLSLELLSIEPNKRTMAAALVNVFPNNESAPAKPHNHYGEEFIYVLEGTLTVLLDDTPCDLYPGDSLHFSAEHSHLWQNHTNKMVRFLAINTAPDKWESYLNNIAPILDEDD